MHGICAPYLASAQFDLDITTERPTAVPVQCPPILILIYHAAAVGMDIGQ